MLDEILLYERRDCPFCLKACLCLRLKGVPFRRVTVTLRRLRELRRLNPLGLVPVLVDGGDVIADSSRIARHLEARYPEPGLIPTDPAARAYALLLEEWADEGLSFIVGAFKWLNPDNRAAALANTVGEMVAAPLRPLVARLVARRERRRYAALGYTAAALDLLVERMRENLSVLEELVDGRPYLLGRGPTLADIAVFAQLTWLERYHERTLLDDAPRVQTWLERLAAAPSFAAALSA